MATPASTPSPTGLSPPPGPRSSGLRLTSRREAGALPCPPPCPSYPETASAAASATVSVWALPRSLAATRGLLSLPRGTEMFQFPRFPPSGSRRTAPGFGPGQVAPFGYPRITGCQRLPGAFRRVATPFLGPRRLGIHRAPSFAAHPGASRRVRVIVMWCARSRGTCPRHRGRTGLAPARGSLSTCSPRRGGRAWTRTRGLGLIRAAL
jgi:hypothetical protein